MHAYKWKSKPFVQQKILEMVPEELLHPQISEALFERDYTKLIEEVNAFRAELGKRPKRKIRKRRRKKLKKI